jgi:hypothetical protein
VIADPRGGVFGVVRWPADNDSAGDEGTTSAGAQGESKGSTK